ncbi:MAG TPA: phenylalanine--tRNA ligase subunit alpha, partial [Desulfarculaceae bacterium]|nr:phenylalanine--tRNA ligase subunit alpha [Desulfarculaceae bacterium]
MKNRLQGLLAEAQVAIGKAVSLDEIESLRVDILGRKGNLTVLLKGLADLPREEKPVIGKLANQIKEQIQKALTEAHRILDGAERERQIISGAVDVTLPGRRLPRGTVHPVTRVTDDVCSI